MIVRVTVVTLQFIVLLYGFLKYFTYVKICFFKRSTITIKGILCKQKTTIGYKRPKNSKSKANRDAFLKNWSFLIEKD